MRGFHETVLPALGRNPSYVFLYVHWIPHQVRDDGKGGACDEAKTTPIRFSQIPLSTAVPRFLQPCLTRCRRLSELLSGDLHLYIIRQSTEHMFTNSVSNAFRRGYFPPIPSIYFKFSDGQKEAFLLQKNDFFKKDCSLALNFLERMFGINFKSLYLHSASVRNVKTHGK